MVGERLNRNGGPALRARERRKALAIVIELVRANDALDILVIGAAVAVALHSIVAVAIDATRLALVGVVLSHLLTSFFLP